MSRLPNSVSCDIDAILSAVNPEHVDGTAGATATTAPLSEAQLKRRSQRAKKSSRHKSHHHSRRYRDYRGDGTAASDASVSGYSGSSATELRLSEQEEAQHLQQSQSSLRRLDSFGNIAYEHFFLGNELLFETQQGIGSEAVGGGKRFTVPPMVDVPWGLREETTAAAQLCSTFSFLGTKHFWWLIEYAARVTFIAMLVPCAIIYAELPHTPFVSMSYALTSVVIAAGTTVGMSMLFFLQYAKAGCIWLPIATVCVALHLDEYLAAWFVVYVVVLFLMAMFTEKTTRRMCLLLFNIPMVALLGGSHDLTYPSRVLADWFLGAAFALLATLLPYPMLATRASREISASLFRNTATCFTGILDCFWAPSNTERNMSMVRVRFLVRTIDQLIDKFDAYDAFTFYEVLFFESYEYRQVRKEKVRLLFQLKMSLRTMERVINMVQEKPQMLDQTEQCMLLRSHVSRPMDAISRSMETLLYHISKAKTYKELRALTAYYELVGRSVKYLQDEFDIARRVLFYESGHYAHGKNHHPMREGGNSHVDDGAFGTNGMSTAPSEASRRGYAHGAPHHTHHHHQGVNSGARPPWLISMDTSVERMEEYVPLMTFFVFSIVNFWGTLRDYEQQMDRVRERPGMRETICFVWRGIIDPFIENARLVKNLFTTHTEPDVRVVIEAAKVSVAMLISVLFFYYVDDHSLLLSGPTIIAFVSGTNPVEAVQASAARLTGTLMGSVLGFFAATLCKTNVDRVASICVITFVMSFFRPEQKFGNICMYCKFVAVSAMTDKTANSNLSRIQQNTFAIFIYCFISVAFFPVSPNKVLFEKRLAVVRGVADTVKRLMGLLYEASISYEETQMRAQYRGMGLDSQQPEQAGMGVGGKSFFPGRRNSTLVPGGAFSRDGPGRLTNRSGGGGEGNASAAPLLFEPVSPAAGAMFPPPAMTNASRLGLVASTDGNGMPAPASSQEAEMTGLSNEGFRGGLGATWARPGAATGTFMDGSETEIGSAPLMRSRVAVDGAHADANQTSAVLLPHAFTMAPEDPTIDGIFRSIFGMLDTMKATTSIMPLAADEFNVVPKEYPQRASGEVHAALYRMCALVYTMASCWKVMRDKGYFTADMVHIFHNLAPLAMDIASCLDRFAHILSYYVHAPSASLSSELTKGVMQLRALCTELSVRKERDLLAVIRQTIIEQQVWRPRRRSERSPSNCSTTSSSSTSSSSESSDEEEEGSGGKDMVSHGRVADTRDEASRRPRTAFRENSSGGPLSRASPVSDSAAPHISNDTLVFNRSLLNSAAAAAAVGATAGGLDESGVADVPLAPYLYPAETQASQSPTEQPWRHRRSDEMSESLVQSVSTQSASMATFSQSSPAPETSAGPAASLASGVAAAGHKPAHHSHATNHGKHQSRELHESRSTRSAASSDSRHGHHARKRRARTASAHGGARGMPHAASGTSLHASSMRLAGRSYSSSALDVAGLADDPHREGAERLRDEVRRARQLARQETDGALSQPHHHARNHASSSEHRSHHHHHHRHAHDRSGGDDYSPHTPFEESMASAPYGSIEEDLMTVPTTLSPSHPAKTAAGKAPTTEDQGQSRRHDNSPHSEYTINSSHKPKRLAQQQRKRASRRRHRARRSPASSTSGSSRSSGGSSARRSAGSRSSGSSSSSSSSSHLRRRRNSSISLVQFNDSFTTPITVYDAEGLHGYTLALEMLAKELRRVLFGLEEMLQNQA